ncbi:Protein SDS23 [Porphyridium purpureum]|uniref:Protein SDS23 n=1 Tax=Porphyridium purpureum TaxID=35688 RepID=A0A5J4ZA53_PORPP|nr:Protein SDS23 [Porphyridium purpureum]|eukprot:POR5038..scf295_1
MSQRSGGWSAEDAHFLRSFWRAFRVRDALDTLRRDRARAPERVPIVLDADTLLEKACERLIEARVRSLVVRDSSKSDRGLAQFIGVFSYRTLVFYTLEALPRVHSVQDLTSSSKALAQTNGADAHDEAKFRSMPHTRSASTEEDQHLDIKALLNDHRSRAHAHQPDLSMPTTVGQYVTHVHNHENDHSELSRPVILWMDDTMDKLVDYCTLGVHRVSIAQIDPVTEQVSIVATVSQTDTIRFFLQVASQKEFASSQLEACLSRSLESVGLHAKAVAGVKSDEPLVNALELMYELKLSALAVVDPATSRLVSTLTMSDVKFAYATRKRNAFHRKIEWTLQQVYATKRTQEEKSRRHTDDNAVDPEFYEEPMFTTIALKQSIFASMSSMEKNKASVLWVLDPHGIPIGAVSSTDLLRVLFPFVY